MNNNDFRVQMPLWNIALAIILMYWMYGVIYAVDLLFTDFEGIFVIANDGVQVNWNIPVMLSIVIGFVLIIVFFIFYFMKLKKHNQMNPNFQLHAFTILRLSEFLEDDEMLRQVTENATKRVYIFYSQVIPFVIVLIAFFPLNRYAYVVMLFLTMMIHHAIYYVEMRKFFSGNYHVNTKKKSSNNKFSKAIVISLIFTFIMLVAIPIVRIVQMENHHNEVFQKYEACLEEGRTATIEFKDNGLTSVECK